MSATRSPTRLDRYDEPLPLVLTTSVVATAFGVSRATAARMFADGRLPGRKLGSRWVIDRETFYACVEPTIGECFDCGHFRAVNTLHALPSGATVCRECRAALRRAERGRRD